MISIIFLFSAPLDLERAFKYPEGLIGTNSNFNVMLNSYSYFQIPESRLVLSPFLL